MKRPRKTNDLPRYVTVRWLKSRKTWGYFFNLPGWVAKVSEDDPRGVCPVGAEKLGTDRKAAVDRAERILLPQFDAWLKPEIVTTEPVFEGTFAWLVKQFKESKAYKSRDRKTKKGYNQGLTLITEHVLKDGRRFGQLQLAEIKPRTADKLYDKLSIVREPVVGDDGAQIIGNDGVPLVRERARIPTAIAAMVAARRAWNVVYRLYDEIVPAANPFSKMGLERPESEESPTATFEELQIFRAKAAEMGMRSLATAALVSWEWAQRGEHVFCALKAEHYRPKHRPDAVRVLHPKNGQEAWVPLFDVDEKTGIKTPLYPELMAELDQLKSGRITGNLIVRDWNDRWAEIPVPWPTKGGDLSTMRDKVREVITAAALRPELSFASFRHGGINEAFDAGATEEEGRSLTRHKSAAILPTYSKITMDKVANQAKKRRAKRTK